MEPVPSGGWRLTRRGALRGGGAVAFVGLSAAALKLPFFGVDGAQIDSASCVGEDLSASDKRLIISNWPAVHRPEATRSRPRRSSSRPPASQVDYTADVNDNSEFYAKVKNQLGSCQSVQRDMMVLTDWMAARMIDLGWIQKLDTAKIPNCHQQHHRPAPRPRVGPGLQHHVPWQSGLTGIAYNADVDR